MTSQLSIDQQLDATYEQSGKDPKDPTMEDINAIAPLKSQKRKRASPSTTKSNKSTKSPGKSPLFRIHGESFMHYKLAKYVALTSPLHDVTDRSGKRYKFTVDYIDFPEGAPPVKIATSTVLVDDEEMLQKVSARIRNQQKKALDEERVAKQEKKDVDDTEQNQGEESEHEVTDCESAFEEDDNE